MERPSSPTNTSSTKLQIVPWFSKEEWLETFHNAYHSSFHLQEKAYTQMCIWKTRYPNLPLGVECTMSTLHVKLCDQETNSNNYKDRDLQLLYSTAVMRFLNQLTVLSDLKDSMYKMAEQHQLPDWIINLRHEAAHGNSVPALYLLRQAADIILLWLKDNYWEVEKDIMKDVIRKPEQEKKRVCSNIMNLLDLWVTLKTNYWAELKTIDKIEDENIGKQAMELATEEGLGIKLSKKSESTARTNKMKTAKDYDDDVLMEEVSANQKIGNFENNGHYTHKIKTAFDPLLRRLFEPLKSKTYKKVLYQNCLIDCFLHHKSFCPPIDVEQLTESEVLELMSLMQDLWKEVIEGLQVHNLLHCLVRQLMKRDGQLMSAQLWLRLISQLIAGHPPPHPPATSRVSLMVVEYFPCAVRPEVLTKRVNLLHMKINKSINLKPASADEIQVLQELGRSAVHEPTKFTTQYLHSLLSLWEPKLSWETKEKLCALARIYNGQQPLRNPPSQVYTAMSFLEQGEKQKEIPTSNSDSHSSAWTLYTGDAGWSQCPLGALPW